MPFRFWEFRTVSIFAVRFTESSFNHAGVAQLVERHLAKVEVAGSSLVSRSNIKGVWAILHTFLIKNSVTRVVELVDTQDLKSCDT